MAETQWVSSRRSWAGGKLLISYFLPISLLVSIALAAPLLALSQRRRAERQQRAGSDTNRWLLVALLLTALLSLGLFIFLLVCA